MKMKYGYKYSIKVCKHCIDITTSKELECKKRYPNNLPDVPCPAG